MTYKNIYRVLGMIFLGLTIISIYLYNVTGVFEPVQIYSPALMTIIAFSSSYLYPQMRQKDERSKFVKQKAMYYSYIALISYLIILLWLLQFEMIRISAIHAVSLILFLTFGTLFTLMVVLSKLY